MSIWENHLCLSNFFFMYVHFEISAYPLNLIIVNFFLFSAFTDFTASTLNGKCDLIGWFSSLFPFHSPLVALIGCKLCSQPTSALSSCAAWRLNSSMQSLRSIPWCWQTTVRTDSWTDIFHGIGVSGSEDSSEPRVCCAFCRRKKVS